MAAERDSLAAEYYSASLADGIENHLEGSYNRFNIAAAVAVGRYFDVPDERIRHAIAGYVPNNNRSQRIGTSRNTLVADCYNANPSSMRASVGNFLAEPLEERQRRVLILGDMLELGDWSEREHAAIIEMARTGPRSGTAARRSGIRQGLRRTRGKAGQRHALPHARRPDLAAESLPRGALPRAGQRFARHGAGAGAGSALTIPGDCTRRLHPEPHPKTAETNRPKINGP